MGELAYEDSFLATVGSVAAVFNCVGRMLFGFLVDKVSYRYALVASLWVAPLKNVNVNIHILYAKICTLYFFAEP